jgi:hypothetical protein
MTIDPLCVCVCLCKKHQKSSCNLPHKRGSAVDAYSRLGVVDVVVIVGAATNYFF